MYHKIYIPFHTNIGCYIGGVVYGYLYYRVRTSDNKGNRSGVSMQNTDCANFFINQIYFFLKSSLSSSGT